MEMEFNVVRWKKSDRRMTNWHLVEGDKTACSKKIPLPDNKPDTVVFEIHKSVECKLCLKSYHYQKRVRE